MCARQLLCAMSDKWARMPAVLCGCCALGYRMNLPLFSFEKPSMQYLRCKRVWIIASLALLIAQECRPFGASAADREGKRYALVVGVTKYRPGQPLPDLSYTENDAAGLA